MTPGGRIIGVLLGAALLVVVTAAPGAAQDTGEQIPLTPDPAPEPTPPPPEPEIPVATPTPEPTAVPRVVTPQPIQPAEEGISQGVVLLLVLGGVVLLLAVALAFMFRPPGPPGPP